MRTHRWSDNEGQGVGFAPHFHRVLCFMFVSSCADVNGEMRFFTDGQKHRGSFSLFLLMFGALSRQKQEQ